jgi:hydroxyacylglutathione hydrolase
VDRGDDELLVLDVRSEEEWRSGRVPGARHAFVPFLHDEVADLDRFRPLAVYCGSGYRSSMAASMLEREGFRDVRNIPGSIGAWKAAGYPLEGG